MDATFTIGTLARRAGVEVQTVRYYERRGLLPPVARKRSGYRLYDEGSLKRLQFIRRAKELGFTLKECGELLALRVAGLKVDGLRVDGRADCEKVRGRAEAKLRDVEGRIKSLKSVRGVLEELVVACKKRRPSEECPILRCIEKGGEKEGEKGGDKP